MKSPLTLLAVHYFICFWMCVQVYVKEPSTVELTLCWSTID